jgi:hypothetical protein
VLYAGLEIAERPFQLRLEHQLEAILESSCACSQSASPYRSPMRPLLWAITLCALLGVVPPASAENWVRALRHPDGSELHVDFDSLGLTDEGLTQFWVKTYFLNPMPLPNGGYYSWTLSHYSINCVRSTFAIVQTIAYNTRGEVMWTSSQSPHQPRYEGMAPGSVVAFLAKEFCELAALQQKMSKGATKAPPTSKQPNAAKSELVMGTGFYVTSVGHVITRTRTWCLVASPCSLPRACLRCWPSTKLPTSPCCKPRQRRLKWQSCALGEAPSPAASGSIWSWQRRSTHVMCSSRSLARAGWTC